MMNLADLGEGSTHDVVSVMTLAIEIFRKDFVGDV